MKFVLVRHGETKANVGKIYSGWSDYELTPRGELQIDLLAGKLKHYDVDTIYCSPLGRTMKTAKKISKVINKEIVIVEELKEINFGIFDGKTAKEIEKKYLDEWQNWIDHYATHKITEGESLEDLMIRTKGFIDSIKKKDGTCIIVSHMGVIGCVISHLLDLQINKIWHFKCPPASYVEIDYTDGFAQLIELNPSRI